MAGQSCEVTDIREVLRRFARELNVNRNTVAGYPPPAD
jgi:hypothetical protein